LIDYPLFACFDDRGRLFVAEGTGKNLPGTELLKLNLSKITLLEDTDGDGRFDTRKTFADRLVMAQGILWHNGSLYVASHPSIWRLEDTDGDDRADIREEFVGKFGFNGNGCDIHGPFLGPDGWIYWTDGRHGYKIKTCEGRLIEGFASRIWRCRTDGTGMERISGGGFDNPVELAFTPDGSLIGTMDQGTGDCLLHYIEGGVYPRGDHPSVKEFPMTGPLLGSIMSFSPALPPALCGLMRVRSDHLGPEYEQTLLTAQFNVHRIQQHILVRDGATFHCINKDFLISTNYDFHPSDVLEDADGSLLVIDMGAWFNYGCPTAKIAKPEVKGVILRVRRAAAPRVEDPWGKSLPLDKMSAAKLLRLLDDPRPKVRDRAVNQLVKAGQSAVPELAAASSRDGKRSDAKAVPVRTRRQTIWALSRIGTPEARAAIRAALADQDTSVRQVATHCVGLERDSQALLALQKMVLDDEPPLRLKAAEALGRLGGPDAVRALLDSLRRGVSGRFLEHALIYGLIRIGDRQTTLDSLDHVNPKVRRAALIALDQMSNGKLTREQVVPLLDTDDPELQQTALEVISRNEGWADEIVSLAKGWLGAAKLSVGQQQSLTGALLAFGGDETIQQLVTATLANPKTPHRNRQLLLRMMTRSRLGKLPNPWLVAMDRVLQGTDRALQHEVLATVKSRNIRSFDKQLAQLSLQKDVPTELRVAALDALAPASPRLQVEQFSLLSALVNDDANPLLRVTAGRALGAARLSKNQLILLAGQIRAGGPLVVPLLTPAFTKSREEPVGLALIAALNQSSGATALTTDELELLVKPFPPTVRTAAQPLYKALAARQEQQETYLAELTGRMSLTPGNPDRGRKIFFSKKVGCYGCHRIGEAGGHVGPDLSHIGRLRAPRALMEAIVFPSSTVVPDYRTYVIATTRGKVFTGMIVRETSNAIYLRTTQLAEIRIPQENVEAMSPSNVSIMPKGLEKTMTPQEFSDLIDFLFQRR
jgi:putative heme-binding domain-containing protein